MIRGRAGAALVLGDQALVSGTQFLTTVLLVRELGLATFGVYSLLGMAIVLAVGLQQGLIAQPMMAIAPKLESAERARYLGAAAALQAGFTVLCLAVAGMIYGFVLMQWDAEILRGTWAPLVAALGARQLHGYVRAGFYVRGERRAALRNDALAYPGQLALLGVLLVLDRLEIATVLWAIAAASGLAAGSGLLRQREWRTTRAEVASAAARHWRTGRWLAAMQGLQFFASNSFLVAAAVLLGTGALGTIKAAQTAMGVLNVGLLAMENVLPIRAAHEFMERGQSGLAHYVARVGRRGFAACAALSGLIAVAPGMVLHPLYGAEVSPELTFALRGFCALYLFSFTIMLLQIAFRTLERTRPIFIAYAINTAVAVLIATPVVTRFGLQGAVLGLVSQQALMAGLLALAFAASLQRARRQPILGNWPAGPTSARRSSD